MKKLNIFDKLDKVLLEATPEQLPVLLDRFQLAMKFRTTNGTPPAKRTRKSKEPARETIGEMLDRKTEDYRL